MFMLKSVPAHEVASMSDDQLWARTQGLLRRDVFRNGQRQIRQVWSYAKSVYVLWDAMRGPNDPLRKRIDGVRDWDFNLDGLAHVGMLPDFLQDAKNVGLTAAQLRPLFTSAEDYIRMWEAAEAAKGNVH